MRYPAILLILALGLTFACKDDHQAITIPKLQGNTKVLVPDLHLTTELKINEKIKKSLKNLVRDQFVSRLKGTGGLTIYSIGQAQKLAEAQEGKDSEKTKIAQADSDSEATEMDDTASEKDEISEELENEDESDSEESEDGLVEYSPSTNFSMSMNFGLGPQAGGKSEEEPETDEKSDLNIFDPGQYIKIARESGAKTILAIELVLEEESAPDSKINFINYELTLVALPVDQDQEARNHKSKGTVGLDQTGEFYDTNPEEFEVEINSFALEYLDPYLERASHDVADSYAYQVQEFQKQQAQAKKATKGPKN